MPKRKTSKSNATPAKKAKPSNATLSRRVTRSMGKAAEVQKEVPALPEAPTMTIQVDTTGVITPAPNSPKPAEKTMVIVELVDMIAQYLSVPDLARMRRVNRSWKSVVDNPSLALKHVLWTVSSKDVLDASVPGKALAEEDLPYRASANNHIFRQGYGRGLDGRLGWSDLFFTASPTQAIEAADLRMEMYISEPPIAHASVSYEIYYFEPPTPSSPATTILTSGQRYVNVSDGIRYKDVRRVFVDISRPLLQRGKLPTVDLHRSRVAPESGDPSLEDDESLVFMDNYFGPEGTEESLASGQPSFWPDLFEERVEDADDIALWFVNGHRVRPGSHIQQVNDWVILDGDQDETTREKLQYHDCHWVEEYGKTPDPKRDAWWKIALEHGSRAANASQ